MSATVFMLIVSGVVSPWLVALMRKHKWSRDLTVVVAVVVSFACFLFGQFADGALTWPPSSDFWLGLAAAFGLQQGGYAVSKRVAPAQMQQVEDL